MKTHKKIILSAILILSFLDIGNVKPIKDELLFSSFSELRMIQLAEQIGIKHIDIMVAQARIESGRYSSNIFNDNNNLFGMKLPRSRQTTAIGINRGHAQYMSWQQSVVDYKLWQRKVLKKNSSRRAYLKWISNNYAENPDYINLIKQQL